MSYPKKIVKVRPIGGIVADLPASEVAQQFYTAGENMHFRSSFAERTKGHAKVYTGTLTTLRNLSNCQIGSTNYWVYHGATTSSVVTGATHTDITKVGLTGTTVANRITSGLLNGVHFFNNGIDAPQFWDGIPANKTADLTGWPASTTCKAMRAFKFHLFAMDISKPAGEFPMQVLWSSAAAPGTIHRCSARAPTGNRRPSRPCCPGWFQAVACAADRRQGTRKGEAPDAYEASPIGRSRPRPKQQVPVC